MIEIIEDRHDKTATIIASQLPVPSWYDIIGEETIADAILDRLLHAPYRIEIKAESQRKNCEIVSVSSHPKLNPQTEGSTSPVQGQHHRNIQFNHFKFIVSH